MKTILLALATLLPVLLFAQQKTEQYFTLGLTQAHLHLRTSDHYEIYSSTGYSLSRQENISHSRGLGVNMGYQRRIHPRWEFSAQLNYAGKSLRDSLHYTYGTLDLPDSRERTYRAFWSEALIFWDILDDRSLVEFQLGTGLSHLILYHEYESGYVYNLDFDDYDIIRTTVERKKGFGLPFHLQVQYPLTYHWKIGGAIQVNTFFNGNQQSGFTAFAAYRW